MLVKNMVRQCNWLDLDALIRAININGVTQVVLNKTDVLKEVGVWKLYHEGGLMDFSNYREMERFIQDTLCAESTLKKIGQLLWHMDLVKFSFSKDKI